MIDDTFQNVSVKKTLQSLMQNRAFVEMTLQDECTPGVLQDVSQLMTQPGKKHIRGIKAGCKLNVIDGYHVTENQSYDGMH